MSELNVFTKELKRRKLELLETCKIEAFKKAEPKIA